MLTERHSRGHIGIRGFHHILNDARFQDIPLILETPSFEKPEVWAAEITALNGMSGASADGLEVVVSGVEDVVKQAGGGASKTKKTPKKAATKKGKEKSKAKDSE